MKISDNELREKLIAHLYLKKEVDTQTLVYFGNTWASNSKIRDVLKSLHEEGLVDVRKTSENKTARVLWRLVDDTGTQNPIPAEEEVVVKPVNEELNKTLKHEFEIILRKQQRRREWAGKILQNAEATIKHLEEQIKWL